MVIRWIFLRTRAKFPYTVPHSIFRGLCCVDEERRYGEANKDGKNVATSVFSFEKSKEFETEHDRNL